MKRDFDSDLLLLVTGAIAMGGLMAVSNSISKSEKKKKKKVTPRDAFYIDFDLSERGGKFIELFKADTIFEEMDDLQTFDAELVKLLTEMGFVVTHIYSENRKKEEPTTAFGISMESDHMPPYTELGHAGELINCEKYDDLLDTDMVKRAVKRVLKNKHFEFDGIKFENDPDECLRRIYADMLRFGRSLLTDVKPSRRSAIGCMSVNINEDGTVEWESATADSPVGLTEYFWEFTVKQRYYYDSDMFNIVSILNKMAAATMLELNLNRKPERDGAIWIDF